MMGDIFSHAKQVSRPTGAMIVAFEYIRLSTGPEMRFPHVLDSMYFFRHERLLDSEYQLINCAVRINALKDGVTQLGSHAYWTRVWTIQESALNENCWIYLRKLNPIKMLEFQVTLYDIGGHMNVRSEALIVRDSGNLYPVDIQRGVQVLLRHFTLVTDSIVLLLAAKF
jgi:hypothetical protein